jgi:protein SCO1/2
MLDTLVEILQDRLTLRPIPERMRFRLWQSGAPAAVSDGQSIRRPRSRSKKTLFATTGRTRLLAAVALVVSMPVAGGCGTHHSSQGAPNATSASVSAASGAQLHGLVPEPFPHKPGFILTDTSGRLFNFANRTRGKLTYLFFGYTHCPDACPATMSEIAFALRLQPPKIRARIEVVFVTVDPRRDTPKVLRAWLNHYNKMFIGLTGTVKQIDAAERAAGVPLARAAKEAGTNYSVAHSSIVFPFSPDNRAHVIYTQGFKPSDYAHDMPLLLKY